MAENERPSNSEIGRLGVRLRNRTTSAKDFRLLDTYRSSFESAYENIRTIVKVNYGYSPVGRLKTAEKIVQKLKRQSARLSQIQDIAGCRIVLADAVAQQRFLEEHFFQSMVFGAVVKADDRRYVPSHGYRAYHAIVMDDPSGFGRVVEVQVRTRAQHLWAEHCEQLAISKDSELKYGGGPPAFLEHLRKASGLVAEIAALEELGRSTDARRLIGRLQSMLGEVLVPESRLSE